MKKIVHIGILAFAMTLGMNVMATNCGPLTNPDTGQSETWQCLNPNLPSCCWGKQTGTITDPDGTQETITVTVGSCSAGGDS